MLVLQSSQVPRALGLVAVSLCSCMWCFESFTPVVCLCFLPSWPLWGQWLALMPAREPGLPKTGLPTGTWGSRDGDPRLFCWVWSVHFTSSFCLPETNGPSIKDDSRNFSLIHIYSLKHKMKINFKGLIFFKVFATFLNKTFLGTFLFSWRPIVPSWWKKSLVK